MSGLFPNLFHVARREYLVRVRGRAFVITTALLAVAVVALTLLPTILAAAGVDDMPSAVIVDQAGDLPVDPVSRRRGRPGAARQRGGRPAPGRPRGRSGGRGPGGSRWRLRRPADDLSRRG